MKINTQFLIYDASRWSHSGEAVIKCKTPDLVKLHFPIISKNWNILSSATQKTASIRSEFQKESEVPMRFEKERKVDESFFQKSSESAKRKLSSSMILLSFQENEESLVSVSSDFIFIQFNWHCSKSKCGTMKYVRRRLDVLEHMELVKMRYRWEDHRQ